MQYVLLYYCMHDTYNLISHLHGTPEKRLEEAIVRLEKRQIPTKKGKIFCEGLRWHCVGEERGEVQQVGRVFKSVLQHNSSSAVASK